MTTPTTPDHISRRVLPHPQVPRGLFFTDSESKDCDIGRLSQAVQEDNANMAQELLKTKKFSPIILGKAIYEAVAKEKPQAFSVLVRSGPVKEPYRRWAIAKADENNTNTPNDPNPFFIQQLLASRSWTKDDFARFSSNVAQKVRSRDPDLSGNEELDPDL